MVLLVALHNLSLFQLLFCDCCFPVSFILAPRPELKTLTFITFDHDSIKYYVAMPACRTIS